MISDLLPPVLRLSSPLTIFVLVASALFATAPAVDARATVQSKRSSLQQQQLQRMQELAPLEEEDADQEPLLSQGLRDKIAGEPWLRAQVRQDFKDISIDYFAKMLSFALLLPFRPAILKAELTYLTCPIALLYHSTMAPRYLERD